MGLGPTWGDDKPAPKPPPVRGCERRGGPDGRSVPSQGAEHAVLDDRACFGPPAGMVVGGTRPLTHRRTWYAEAHCAEKQRKEQACT